MCRAGCAARDGIAEVLARGRRPEPLLQPVEYAVCSLDRAEGSDRIAATLCTCVPLACDPMIDADEVPSPAALAPAVDGDGAIQTLPCQFAQAGGLDGFYIRRLRRT